MFGLTTDQTGGKSNQFDHHSAAKSWRLSVTQLQQLLDQLLEFMCNLPIYLEFFCK
jgi:hypothetical protein